MERLRAVAACRCSTEEESQKDALMQQVSLHCRHGMAVG